MTVTERFGSNFQWSLALAQLKRD